MTTPREPRITIDGHPLTEEQACAVRVAICSYRWQVSEPDALGSDPTGHAIAAGYAARLAEVDALLVPASTDPWICPNCEQQNRHLNTKCFLCARPRGTP